MTHFDKAAADWDKEPRRIALMQAIGEAILREAAPTRDMDLLDYGCGTGLVGLFLLPHVRSVTGADNSPGILETALRFNKPVAGQGEREFSVFVMCSCRPS